MTSTDAVVVTGAGRGIGKEAALALGRLGLDVLCISRSERALTTASEIVDADGTATGADIDIADLEAVGAVVAEWAAARRGSRLGAVLAAADLGPPGPLLTTDLRGWGRAFEINVLGNLAVVRGLLPDMYATGFGRVVAFAGGGAAYAYPVLPGYAASKTAMVRAVENLAVDFDEQEGDLSVVCIAPGAVETDTLARVRELGGEVRTVTEVGESVAFIVALVTGDPALLNGRFVHVRDEWARLLAGAPGRESAGELDTDRWKLRRVE